FDYSAVGDEVNVTSRLEGLTKLYGLPAVVSEATLAKSKQKFPALELDVIAVRGRTRPTRVYTLLGLFSPHRSGSMASCNSTRHSSRRIAHSSGTRQNVCSRNAETRETRG